eukprot:CAMPEP_0201540044 /NCGR_PEP_ID=MMETSP0161_2-20130828/70736_1 /ASSEMBLY_ACC=CAM_ASM_000251 /TAXON_ID=180227 /ORGANISM="Neoparamoeba aestuarina, Strain SoJaBio B1-5/56/2" /LENGTH=48 /DNA_ID= /DNA_START= /DNA_END= /DNA_ORIENTATION=
MREDGGWSLRLPEEVLETGDSEDSGSDFEEDDDEEEVEEEEVLVREER